MRAYNDEPEIMKTSADVEFVRTPDSCFDGLPDWPYEPNYVEIDGLRQAYVDEGSADGQVVLLLHGQPSWSYLYRKMIPVLADAGMRVIAMDHLGMGRSDKPTEITSYSYLGHCDRLQRFIEALDLRDINLFVQDWGSLIGLRVAGLNPDRFARIAVGDGMLPTWPEGVQPFPPVENPNETVAMTSIFEGMPAQQVPFYNGCEPIGGLDDGYFGNWMAYSMKAESFRASEVVEAMTWFDLPADEEAAYDAPFPSRTYMAGPRVFPSLANEVPGTTQEAWAGLTAFQKPFVTIWAANDPGNLGSCQLQNMLACSVAGAKDQPHARLAEASHFLQDDQGAEIARRLVAFIKNDTSVLGNYEPSCGLPITDTSSLELTPTLCDDPNNMEAVLEALQSGEGGGMFGNVNQAQLQRMLAAPTDGPFYMVNLIKYRERAVYADGRETDLTGREANALYAPTEFLQAIGARAVFNTEVHDQIDGDDVLWDDFTVVEYPCPLAFLAMLSTPDFQARAVHKEAGVEKTIVIVTNLLPIPAPADPDQSEAAFPPTTEDPAFDLIHVMDFYDIAQYEPDANEPERTGKEAWQMYQASGQGASTDLGHYSTAALVVQGVFTGDDRTWDEIQIVHMSSMAGFQALLDDDTRVAGRYHRLAALQHNYSMITFPTVSQIPYADGDSGSTGSLPVTSDGTGTICQTDDDCPGDGVNKCLTDGSGVGFCTREGCEIGDCEPPYLCCRDCNPAVAAMLPFEGSACIPGNMVGQLTAAPVSCTCD
jgi:pimeloyl-ACP methyl ester carboxylesterase